MIKALRNPVVLILAMVGFITILVAAMTAIDHSQQVEALKGETFEVDGNHFEIMSALDMGKWVQLSVEPRPAPIVPDIEEISPSYKIRWDVTNGRRYMQRDGQWHVWTSESKWLAIPDTMLPKNLSAK